ncbi:MAG TPA: hypothetical protein VGQ99_13505 [Tepidisphaeraceae bacterium]|jgi:hypothetical protein|nr:hypothetical protein [Tepidisphaeraceae bacterium]
MLRWWKDLAEKSEGENTGRESRSGWGGVMMEWMEERVLMASDFAGVVVVAQIWDSRTSQTRQVSIVQDM